MDDYVWYNQIKMVVTDIKKIIFIMFWGTYYYEVMSFGLKNVRVIY